MKFFQREQRSLFGEILDWMLTPLLLLWPISLVLTWLVAEGIAGRPFDRALEYNVQALAQLVRSDGLRVEFNLPAPAREILRADDIDLIYYQVLGSRGEFLSGERDLPLPVEDEREVSGEVMLRDDAMKGLIKEAQKVGANAVIAYDRGRIAEGLAADVIGILQDDLGLLLRRLLACRSLLRRRLPSKAWCWMLQRRRPRRRASASPRRRTARRPCRPAQ